MHDQVGFKVIVRIAPESDLDQQSRIRVKKFDIFQEVVSEIKDEKGVIDAIERVEMLEKG